MCWDNDRHLHMKIGLLDSKKGIKTKNQQIRVIDPQNRLYDKE